MIDFTQKGTKLPIIPTGTEYKVQDGGICNKIYKHIDFVSFGMFDDIWLKCESSNYISKTNHYLIKLSTIERLAKEQGMYNTNNEQMKTQITLNSDGGIVISNTVSNPNDKGFTITTNAVLSKETALQIYEVVKADLEKPILEVGKWYESPCYLICYIGNNLCYGFSKMDNMKFHEKLNHSKLNHISGKYKPAPTETVETALRNEELKRYGREFELICCKSGKKFKIEGNYRYFNHLGNWCHLGNVILSNTGQWATIIKPETISIQEAEKRTGCVVDKNL